MKVLLDTHAFLWWIEDNPQLSSPAREIIRDGANQVYLSAASGWEMVIKARLNKLKLPAEPARFIAEQLTHNAFHSLPIRLSHALHVFHLPLLHRDPFDRILAAQSLLEKMPLVTADPQLAAYGIEVVW